MKLSAMDLFCWKKATSTSAAFSNVLDFGTDGNSPFEPATGNVPVNKTGGTHGDDILNKLYWCLHCATDSADGNLTVVWETSDNDPGTSANNNASKVEVWSKTIAAANLTKGAYPIANEALPKGLKRYNRLKLTGSAGSDSSVVTKAYPSVTAFVIDGRDEPIA